MKFDLEKAVEKIKNNKDFLKLKKVIENNTSHDHEAVYDHLIKTYDIARKEIKADYITTKEAKKSFENYINQKVGGIKKKDLMLIFALIHDIGKSVIFEENHKLIPLLTKRADGTTFAVGHEYWGSLIVEKIVEDAFLPKIAISYLSKAVRLHDTFNQYWNQNKKADKNQIIEGLKRKSENMHVELTFNSYCDCFTAPPFQDAIPLIHKLFNDPSFYNLRKYSIID